MSTPEHFMNELNKNQILRNVQKLLEEQTKKGLQKYGTTVNPADYDFIGWLEHLQQEMIDAIVYCETLKIKYAHLVALEKTREGT
ncbi:hypothetical protein QT236_14460 [Geobacillus stearothermophilus]|nr:hypothetical protein QT236_12620 [Geobacillus stearothermophilus]WJQ03221.1 hypothetical protein QT236_14460 [Geobacillus stearothermophilus]